MATYINKTVNKKEVVIYNTGDWHVGSLCFHEAAARKLVEIVEKEKAYLTFGGDAIEGKKVDSPHFNPDGLAIGKLNIQKQAKAFVELIKPIANRVLMVQGGNHELHLLKDFDIVEYICDLIGTPDIYGHYQTWLNVNGCTMHFWHGKAVLPRGAKDPIQREANQKAWLKNKLYQLSGSAQAQYMGHTHFCMIVEPIDQYALLDSGENVRGVEFREQVREIDGKVWAPPDARWYVNTGTLRRGGGFDHQDYSEIAGYNPPPIACTKTTIVGNRIDKIEKVLF